MRRLMLCLLATCAVLAVPATASAYLVGVADQHATMFVDPLYTQLLTHQSDSQRISRYIAPYDAADGSRKNVAYLNDFINWYNHAKADHVKMLVAFYHSEQRRKVMHMPSVRTYTRDVQRFMSRFPDVEAWQPWNEANRGNIPHQLASPSPRQAAEYYKALARTCPRATHQRRCTITGLDILDQNNVGPTLRYIAQFRRELRRLHMRTPRLWGLHNYSDTNRFGSFRTRSILRAVPGQVWLTETGGIVKFGRAFPNHNGSGLRRAEKALKYLFRLAHSNRRISRLYIFDWTGGNSRTRFDAGLLDDHGIPRPGYVVVCRELHAPNCDHLRIDHGTRATHHRRNARRHSRHPRRGRSHSARHAARR